MLKTQIATYILFLNAQNKPRLFEAGLSTTDTLKISNENNTAFSRQDDKIATVPGDMGYAGCEYEISA